MSSALRESEMPTRIDETFSRCREEGRSALIPYFTSGHPEGKRPAEIMGAIAAAGADLIELGIPFSDPLADGPVIQASSFAALAAGASVASTLEGLREFRTGDPRTPVVLFSYLNPILAYGAESFVADATAAGADGVLLTDLPVGADPALEERMRVSSLDLIRLVAPTSGRSRVREIANDCSGFVYYISRTGVTGGESSLRGELDEEVQAVRHAVGLPVAVGFGIATPRQARWVAGLAEGVVVGSALVRALDAGGLRAGTAFVRALRSAMDARESHEVA